MVISTSTSDIINYALDAQNEYNIKLILYAYLLIMAAIAFFVSRKIDRTNMRLDLIFYGLQIYSWTAIVFMPLYFFTLVRTVPLSTIINIVAGFYMIFFTSFFLILIFWLGEKFLERYFGIKFNDSDSKHRSDRDYRRVD